MNCPEPNCTRPGGHAGRHRIVYANGGQLAPPTWESEEWIAIPPGYNVDFARSWIDFARAWDRPPQPERDTLLNSLELRKKEP